MSARQLSSTSYPITFLLVLSIDHITGATGKTPTVTLSKNGGSFGAATGAVSEIANGIYALAGNATDRNTLGELRIHVTATGCDPVDMVVDVTTGDPFASASVDLTPVTDQLDDIQAKTDTIGTATALATSPTIAANTVRIVRGDDYASADSRAIDLVYSGQPDFTSATNVTMKVVSSNKAVATTIATWTGSVLNSTTLRFTPTDTETALLPAINSATQITYPFEVSLTLASGSVITPTSLHAGKLIVDSQAT